MIKFKKASAFVAGVLALTTIAAPAVAAVVFDDFTQSQVAFDSTTDATGVFGTQVTGGTIFGDYREVYAFKGGEVGTDAVGARVTTSVNLDRANFSSDNNSFGFGLIRWDGDAQTGVATNLQTNVFGASTSTFLGNLYDFGSGFKVTYNSDAAFDIEILVYTTTGVFIAGQPVADTLNFDVTDTVLFNEFQLYSGTGTTADLANTRAVEVLFNGFLVNLGRLDMEFAPPLAVAVPEPASLALVGLGLLGIGISRRRRA